jgi:CRP/FNR family transcriptional regulator, dissimilatory nitrate respiration regulator
MRTRIYDLGPELFETIQKLGHVRAFGEGEQVFAANEKALYLPIVISGRVKMVHISDSGKETVVGIFESGEMFAVPPVFDGLSYPASAYATVRTEVLILPREDCLSLLRRSNEFAFLVLGWMSEMLREKTAIIQNLARNSPERRIAATLLKLTENRADESPFLVNIRRQDIAEMTNLTTETVIRATRRLAEKNLVRIERGKIFIDDAEPLRRFVD